MKKACIQTCMELEQRPPNRPNFLHVVLMACAAILVIFVIALALVGFDGKRLLHFHYRHAQQTSSVATMLPGLDC